MSRNGVGRIGRAVPDQDPAALERDEEPAVAGVSDRRDAAERSRDLRQHDVGRHRRRFRRVAIRGGLITGPPFMRPDTGDGDRRHGNGDAEQYRDCEFRPHAAIITTTAGRKSRIQQTREEES